MSSVAFAVHFCCPIDAPSQVATDVYLTSTTHGNGGFNRPGGVDIDMQGDTYVDRGDSLSDSPSVMPGAGGCQQARVVNHRKNEEA
ncbi:MAG: hypothetical protein OXC27_19260 [Caldilineaceae bacterium]|nr:hypothetical protein [Caldilineaceae bacterium]